jgi:murein DD-endopeptidase MepM/ murein hydrolase activator NlpD
VADQRKSRSARVNHRIALALGIAALVAGCASQASPPALPSTSAYIYGHPDNRPSQTHTVAVGETVYHIARSYGLSPERLMAANAMNDARELRVGQVLTIPGHPLVAASVTGIPEGWSAPRAERQFTWPLSSGELSSPFGIRNGVMHSGIDIAAPAGTPVHAADGGAVIFAGWLRGYGNVVIIQHTDGYVTVYGHNERNLVHEGETVARGQTIGELGSSGRASGPNLHFEIRCNNHPQNPIAYLPAPGLASGITFARNTGD